MRNRKSVVATNAAKPAQDWIQESYIPGMKQIITLGKSGK